MPKPGKRETQDEFLARCIPQLIKEGKDQQQAVAICYSMWKDGKSKDGVHASSGHMNDKT